MSESPRFNLDARFVASKQQISNELGDEVVLLNLDAGEYHGISGTGVRIWELLKSPRSVREIVQTITSEYEVDPQQCQSDVIELVGKLLNAGLIEAISAAG